MAGESSEVAGAGQRKLALEVEKLQIEVAALRKPSSRWNLTSIVGVLTVAATLAGAGFQYKLNQIKAEQTALVRHVSRLFVTGANLSVPTGTIILRKGYGLGAQAMLGGSTHEPLMTVGWPGAHLGAMGLEGAVRLAMRKELEAIDDPDERERQVRELTAHAQANASALNVARHFEIDDVIDPAETRGLVAQLVSAAARDGRLTGSGAAVDTW